MPDTTSKGSAMKTQSAKNSTKAASPNPKAPKRPTTNQARFTDAEQAAMKERARELKAEARAGKNKADGDREVLAKIAELPEPDRTLGRRLHEIVTSHAPHLIPRTWYGMPAYANPPPPAGNGKVVCFFQAAAKFKTRYATFAFTDEAKLDDGKMWPTGFALTDVRSEQEAKLAEMIKTAVG